MPTLTIDGHEITVDPGTRIIDAADRLGIDIPRFCYHPGLSVAANCRMCLVEHNKSPKLVPSCYDTCQEGLVVQTKSPKVLEARRAVLEYILLNHPVDCPICDQAGECDLQDQYFAHDHQPSRHAFRKHHKAKARVLGPNVIYDAERCINCTRCVRVSAEVAKAPQLQQVQRGERTYIDVFPGKQLDHPYSMLTSDVCPVGALTPRDFRFKCRVWFLEGTQSVCGECSRGCAVRVDTYHNEVQRVMPRENPNVNKYWACDAGRLAYHRFETERLATPRVRGADATYAAALKALADDVAALPPDAKAVVVLTPFLACEDVHAVATFIRSRWPGAIFAVGGRANGAQDEVLIRADKNPNRIGVNEVLRGLGIAPAPLSRVAEAAGGALWVFGEAHAGGEALPAALAAAKLSVVVAPLQTALAGAAGYVFPSVSPYETDGTWMNEFRVLQRVRAAVRPAADVKQAAVLVADLAERLGAPLAGAADAAGRFEQLAGAVPAFQGLSLGAIGPHGVVVGG